MKKSEIKNIISNASTILGIGAGLGFSCVATEALKNFAKSLAPKGSNSILKWTLFGIGTVLLMDKAADIILTEAKTNGTLAGELAVQFMGEPDDEDAEVVEEEKDESAD